MFTNCKKFSITEANVCDECKTESIRSKIGFECTKVDPLITAANPPCLQYDDQQKCVLCDTNYVLYENSGQMTCYGFNGCKSLKSITNTNLCGECLPGFYMYQDECHLVESNCYFTFDKNTTKDSYPF